jgi:hypothetical protein
VINLLHLFSGPAARKDGMTAILRKIGCSGVDVDITNAESGSPWEQCDLASDQLWLDLVTRVSNKEFTFVWMGTPCTTFSVARSPALRSVEHLYGKPKSMLSPSDQAAVQQGNYFAFKSANMAWTCLEHGIGFAIENPEPWPGHPSLFLLPELVELQKDARVTSSNFDQCTLGAETTKPTRIVSSGLAVSKFSTRCTHPYKQWKFMGWDWQPTASFGAHPPLFGRRRESGEPATKASAAYPYAMNKSAVGAMLDGATGRPPASQS